MYMSTYSIDPSVTGTSSCSTSVAYSGAWVGKCIETGAETELVNKDQPKGFDIMGPSVQNYWKESAAQLQRLHPKVVAKIRITNQPIMERYRDSLSQQCVCKCTHTFVRNGFPFLPFNGSLVSLTMSKTCACPRHLSGRPTSARGPRGGQAVGDEFNFPKSLSKIQHDNTTNSK